MGAIDWNLRDFHGYETPNGTTYNAYLVIGDDKIALVDTVKTAFVPELLERIRERGPARQDRLHRGQPHRARPQQRPAPGAWRRCRRAKVVASAGGVRGIAEYHGPDLEIAPVGADDIIDLGGKTLRFMPMPMVHWPDSMFTFCPEVCTLMCNDAFGQHLATSERFADEIDLDLAIEELTAYYANILMPLSTPVAKSIAKIIDLGWTCDIIAPSHGVIFRRESVPAAFDTYDRLTSGDTYDKLVIAYSTMWGSTDVLAREIADGAAEAGVDVHVFDIAETSLALITRHLVDSRALLLGSPTLHHGMLYRVAAYLQYIAGLKPKDKLAGVFGSYGWSSGATKQMRGRLEEIGFEVPTADFTVKFKPSRRRTSRPRARGAARWASWSSRRARSSEFPCEPDGSFADDLCLSNVPEHAQAHPLPLRPPLGVRLVPVPHAGNGVARARVTRSGSRTRSSSKTSTGAMCSWSSASPSRTRACVRVRALAVESWSSTTSTTTCGASRGERTRAPSTGPASGSATWRGRLRSADRITTSSEPLRKLLLRLRNRDVRVIPNHAPRRSLAGGGQGSRAPGAPLVIGWAGGTSPSSRTCARWPTCSSRCSTVTRTSRFTSPVRTPSGSRRTSGLRFLESVPLGAVRRSCSPASTSRIAPLHDNRFNQSKSDLKVLEYAMIGLPVVASKVAPYSASVRHGRDGVPGPQLQGLAQVPHGPHRRLGPRIRMGAASPRAVGADAHGRSAHLALGRCLRTTHASSRISRAYLL